MRNSIADCLVLRAQRLVPHVRFRSRVVAREVDLTPAMLRHSTPALTWANGAKYHRLVFAIDPDFNRLTAVQIAAGFFERAVFPDGRNQILADLRGDVKMAIVGADKMRGIAEVVP